jgi:hypothetical protein
MSLSLGETNRAIRTAAGRRQLVLAIRDAPDHEMETDSIEWKDGINLRESRWKVEIARQVIGFANRHPDRARRVFEGCAYLVLGVKPGKLSGVAPIDPAQLEDAVSTYMGRDGPEWDADYVETEDATVLVVTVEPPRWGDRIFALEKEFSFSDGHVSVHYRSGDVFVRRQGKTERANAQEMRMLSDRAAASGERLAVDLTWWEDEVTPVQPIDLGEDAVKVWLDSERARLLRAVETVNPPAKRVPMELQELSLKISRAVAMEPEQRSLDDYRAEVDEYLKDAEEALVPEVRRLAVAHGLGKVALCVVNLTEHNFAQVGVELVFEGRVASYFDEDNARWEMDNGEIVFPDPPRPWGKATSRFGQYLHPAQHPLIGPTSLARESPGWTNNTDSTRIVFATRDLRPGYQYQLGPVHLIVGAEHAGDTLIGSWHATSTNVSGRAEGTFEVPIHEEPVSLSAVMEKGG